MATDDVASSRCLVTTEEYQKFRQDFSFGVFPPDLRYGQAFYNIFFARGKIRGDLPWPELFYKISVVEAHQIIQTEVFKYEQADEITTNI